MLGEMGVGTHSHSFHKKKGLAVVIWCDIQDWDMSGLINLNLNVYQNKDL